MREQIAIPASGEMDRGRRMSCVRLPVDRADRCDRRIPVTSDHALAHDRCQDDEPHGEQAKPRGQSIAEVSGHDVGHGGRGGILAEMGRDADEMSGICGQATRQSIALRISGQFAHCVPDWSREIQSVRKLSETLEAADNERDRTRNRRDRDGRQAAWSRPGVSGRVGDGRPGKVRLAGLSPWPCRGRRE